MNKKQISYSTLCEKLPTIMVQRNERAMPSHSCKEHEIASSMKICGSNKASESIDLTLQLWTICQNDTWVSVETLRESWIFPQVTECEIVLDQQKPSLFLEQNKISNT